VPRFTTKRFIVEKTASFSIKYGFIAARATTPNLQRPLSGGRTPPAGPGALQSNPPGLPDRWRKVWSLCAPANQRFSRRRLRAYLRRQMARREAEQRRAEERFFRRLPPQPLDGPYPSFSGPSPAQLLRGEQFSARERHPPYCDPPLRKLRKGCTEKRRKHHDRGWGFYRAGFLGEGTTPEPYAHWFWRPEGH
jgi:hypothetical protein